MRRYLVAAAVGVCECACVHCVCALPWLVSQSVKKSWFANVCACVLACKSSIAADRRQILMPIMLPPLPPLLLPADDDDVRRKKNCREAGNFMSMLRFYCCGCRRPGKRRVWQAWRAVQWGRLCIRWAHACRLYNTRRWTMRAWLSDISGMAWHSLAWWTWKFIGFCVCVCCERVCDGVEQQHRGNNTAATAAAAT